MELNVFQEKSKRTMNRGMEQYQALANYALGLTGESGEVVDHIKKAIFHGHALDVDKVEEELGDVLFYLSAIATTVGLSLDAIAQRNIEKLRQRYPEGFSEEASKARVDTLPTAEAINETYLTPEQRERIARRFGWGD